jgi:hypothetical protein
VEDGAEDRAEVQVESSARKVRWKVYEHKRRKIYVQKEAKAKGSSGIETRESRGQTASVYK